MALTIICSTPITSSALDGRADVRGYQQGGRAGELTYKTENLWENYSLDQRLRLPGSTIFQIRYGVQREYLWSRTGGITSRSRKETQTPFMSLSYRNQRIRAGLTGNGMRKDTFVPGESTRRDENLTSSVWARTDIGQAELNARYLDTRSWRKQEFTSSETRNNVLGFIARFAVTDEDRLRYSLSNTNNEVITSGTETKYLSNILEYRGIHRFAQDRGRVNVTTTVSRFDQRNIYRIAGTREYITPIWGGVLWDDTPEENDPLEPDPEQESQLYDNDLETATAINIGSSAPVVREFGGDYRNIILDFGDPAPMDSIILHIDAQIDFPGLIQWQVFVSNDPEGRIWGQALTSDVATVSYREWELGRQGWEVNFANPLVKRRVKLVNVKLGVTEPDIFITEMQVFSPPDDQKDEIKTTLSRYRLYGDVRYDVLPNLEVNYAADIYEHRQEGVERDLSGAVHQLGSNWRINDWDLTGHYQVSTLKGSSEFRTDANSQLLTLARRFNPEIDSRLSWKRTEDNSHTLNYTTQDITLDFNWRFAPGLVFNQKTGRGLRTDHQTGAKNGSWALISSVRSNPVRTLSLDLRRVDRWVDENAGSGFTTFNNTELITRWSILPLLAYSNQVVYRRRDGSDWSARNQLAWSPMPGGNLGMSFNLSDFRDTRIDIKQKSAGGNLNWRVRSNARLEFGAEYVVVWQRGEENRPHNLYVRGSMNF